MKKIVLFGDSLFNGFRNGQDTNLITDALQEKLGNNAQVENFSKSGATTVEGLDFLTQIPQDADLILIEYGTNDSSIVGVSSQTYEKNLKKMIKICGPNKVTLVGPWQDKYGNEYIIPEHLTKNRQIVDKLAQEYHLPKIDLLTIRTGEKNVDKLYQADNLHLTDYGNQKLVALLYQTIKKELEN